MFKILVDLILWFNATIDRNHLSKFLKHLINLFQLERKHRPTHKKEYKEFVLVCTEVFLKMVF